MKLEYMIPEMRELFDQGLAVGIKKTIPESC